jgi:hypothetical protein
MIRNLIAGLAVVLVIAGCGSSGPRNPAATIPVAIESAQAATAPTGADSAHPTDPAAIFLTPLPAVTIGTESRGRWSVVLSNSLVSAQPLSGSAATGPTDRLLEVRLTVTYLSPGPPGDFGEGGVQLDELPSDLGLKHVPTPEEEDAEGPESKAVDCGQAEIKNLCDVIGGSGETWEMYTDQNGAPGGAISPAELDMVEPNQSESFWLVGHVSEHLRARHVVLVIQGQLLSAKPRA